MRDVGWLQISKKTFNIYLRCWKRTQSATESQNRQSENVNKQINSYVHEIGKYAETESTQVHTRMKSGNADNTEKHA